MTTVNEERTPMNIKRFATRRTLVVGAVVAVVALGAGAAVAATSGVFDPKQEQEAFQAAVAAELGVTTTELQNAYKAASLERLDAAVAAGRLTEEQADAIRERIESGDFLGPHFGFGGPGMHGPGFGFHLAGAADYLGLTEVELHEKLRAGQSLAEIAKAEGKSVSGLEQAMLAAAKTNLDQAVKDGKLTQAQADAMLDRLEANIDDLVNRTGPPDHGPGFGFRSGGGPMHGSWSPPDA